MPAYKEAFLHFVWRTHNFDMRQLKTTDGQVVRILHPGTWNHDQGPDFLDARLRIGAMEWHGHVELHVDAREWYAHKHHQDKNYNGTILHVVASTKGAPVRRADGTQIPELIIGDRISAQTLKAYDSLFLSQEAFPCQSMIHKVAPLPVYNWVERLAFSRVRYKANLLAEKLSACGGDWDQLIWEEFAGCMGGPVNGASFRQLAQKIPVKLLQKLHQEPVHLEALLLGAAGFLPGKPDQREGYVQALTDAWHYLSDLYQIPVNTSIPFHYLRMRPPAFPTMRLVQLAALASLVPNWSTWLHFENIPCLQGLNIIPSTYWETHYRLQHETAPHTASVGKQQKHLLIINVLLPICLLYHQRHNSHKDYSEVIEQHLGKLPPESNKLTRPFAKEGFPPESALHSQGIIELRKFYCSEKRCLECGIGFQVLKRNKKSSKHAKTQKSGSLD